MRLLLLAIIPFPLIAAPAPSMTCTTVEPDGLVRLEITCTNHTATPLSNLPIQVCYTNASTNIAGVLVPVCFLLDYEVWVTNTTGGATNIVTRRPSHGPPLFRGSGYWLFNPGKSTACTLEVPLPDSIEPGKYTLALKRWCSVFPQWDGTGTVTSFTRMHLKSNPLQIEVVNRQ